MVKHKANDNEFYDLYGNEIIGLRMAKTKEEQIAALEAHLLLVIEQQRDVESSLENRISRLKYGTKYS